MAPANDDDKKPATANGDETVYATGSSAPKRDAPRRIEAMLGAKVRALRKRRDLTVTEMATRAGISVGMASKIENGAISPSLASLQALAEALSVPIGSLFAEVDDSRDASHVAAGHGLTIERRGTKSGHRYELLGHSVGSDTALEPYLITLAHDAVPYTEFRHEGLEFLYMLEGEVGYRHGDRQFVLKPGDSLLFDADVAHGPEALIKLPARFLSIIVFPRD